MTDSETAYAGLAVSYIGLGVEAMPPREVFPKAKIYALKALELNETLGEAHFSLGEINYLYEWNWSAAQRELERTLELNPKAVETNAYYLHSLGSTGKTEEAITQVRRALELNPLSIVITGNPVSFIYVGRRERSSVGVAAKII